MLVTKCLPNISVLSNAFNIAFENDKDNIWNSKIEITQNFCDKIEKALEEVEEIW